MAESSAMNSGLVDYTNRDDVIKKEDEVKVKEESLECLVCTSRSRECFDIYTHNTSGSGASVHQFIVKYTQGTPVFSDSSSKFVCKSCYDLINILEQAELEYVKLKETFEAIISKNPLFENLPPNDNTEVKNEVPRVEEDSEDEPLARTKKTRNIKPVKKKKRMATTKKKQKVLDSWACDECDVSGDTGGSLSLAAHKLTMHTLPEETAIKTEDGSQSPYNNGHLDDMDIEFDNFEDDNDSTYNPEEYTEEIVKKKKVKMTKKVTEKGSRSKQIYYCDQCNARYSSLVRLESHKQKHDGSKPPYICEVCGAHYKHKRACDIHIALHKGISDWKCEECNKLFPSKNALQRHNNIHTGKLNYQCDLCGKSFIHTSSFKMHKLAHSGVKPHACDVCGLALMTRSHLKRHKRIHSGEKRHECTVCGKRFSERYNLAAHQKSHEGGTEARAEAGAQPDMRRRLFRCHFCTDRFERRYMLERHMAVVHGRALERPPPTPRNTMSKLLKQRAQRPHAQESSEAKDERSSESRTPSAPIPPSKLLAQLANPSVITAGAWNSAYAAEFGIRPDFTH